MSEEAIIVEKVKSLIYNSKDLSYTLQRFFRSPSKSEKELLQSCKYKLLYNNYIRGFWIYELQNGRIAIAIRLNERKYYGVVQKVYFYLLRNIYE